MHRVDADAYSALVAQVMRLAPGEVLSVLRERIPARPPSWRRSVGIPRERAFVQYRDGLIHVHATRTHYHIHRDTVDAHAEPLRHLREDAPRVWRAMTLSAALAVALAAVWLVWA